MISIIINVKNGERYLSQCLNSVIDFEDVVLLDNHSTDSTISIAQSYHNVKIFTSDFLGMGKVRNLAMSYAKYDWVLFLDCDEVLNIELKKYLLTTRLICGNIYKLRRLNYYDNYLLQSSSWENDWILRLFNRQETKFIEQEVHETLIVKNLNVTMITFGNIYHFPYENINGLIDKMQFYSSLYAKQHFNKKRPKLYTIPIRAFFMFLKCYILKRGFLDGYEGLLVSSYNAMGVFSKYIKLYELYYKKDITLVVTIDKLTTQDELLNIIENINTQTKLPQLVVFKVKHMQSLPLVEIEHIIKSNIIVKYHILSYDAKFEPIDNKSVLLQINTAKNLCNKNYILSKM